MPPIMFRKKNDKQTPSGTTILRRVRRRLIQEWHYGNHSAEDRGLIPLAIAAVDTCLSKCAPQWRDRF